MLQPIPESDSISNFDDAMDVDGASQSGRIIKNSLEAWDEYTNSEDYSSGRASPAPSQYTVTDSLLDSCFEDKHGRKVNTTSETYVFAADVEEESRLEFEHNLFKIAIGDLFIGPVAEVLKESTDESKEIVDLGTGSGVWAMEMAQRFPHVHVVGIDLVPIQRPVFQPLNCDFEVDDLNLDLSHLAGRFSYAHARMISNGIQDYPGFIHQLSQIVKPGGLIQLFETEFRSYYKKEDGKFFMSRPIGHPDHLWFVDWQNMLLHCMRKVKANVDAASLNRKWIREDPSFEEVEYQDLWLPTGPFLPSTSDYNNHQNRLGYLLLEDIGSYVRSARPLLLDHYAEKNVDEIERNAIEEMRGTNRPPTWIRVTIVCARRKPLADSR